MERSRGIISQCKAIVDLGYKNRKDFFLRVNVSFRVARAWYLPDKPPVSTHGSQGGRYMFRKHS
jgi:hypothetical protein